MGLYTIIPLYTPLYDRRRLHRDIRSSKTIFSNNKEKTKVSLSIRSRKPRLYTGVEVRRFGKIIKKADLPSMISVDPGDTLLLDVIIQKKKGGK